MSISEMSFWERILYILERYGASFLKGSGTTMVIALICTFIGCIIGFAVGIVQTIPSDKSPLFGNKASPMMKKIPLTNRLVELIKRFFLGLMKFILSVYVEVFRGTPMMIQAVFIYYGSAQLFNLHMDSWTAALIVVSINTGAYMAETVRGGIISIDPGQTEGAKAIGMTHFQTMLYVIFPQTLRNIMPQIGNNLIINIKDTCVLSIISTVELFFTFKSVAGALYTYFEAATITMVIYFVLTFVCSRLLRLWEKRLDGPDSYDLATSDSLAHTSGMYTHPKVYKSGNRNLDQRGER